MLYACVEQNQKRSITGGSLITSEESLLLEASSLSMAALLDDPSLTASGSLKGSSLSTPRSLSDSSFGMETKLR